jgi:hypothetical protein
MTPYEIDRLIARTTKPLNARIAELEKQVRYLQNPQLKKDAMARKRRMLMSTMVRGAMQTQVLP